MAQINDLVQLAAKVLQPTINYTAQVEEAVKSNLPCRMQTVSLDRGTVPKVVLDVGHNEDAIGRVLAVLESRMQAASGRKYSVVFGCKASKDLESIWSCFFRFQHIIDTIYLVDLGTPLPTGEIVSRVRELCLQRRELSQLKFHPTANTVTGHLNQLLSTKDDILEGVLVIGSFHMMPEALEVLGIEGETDAIDMNNTYRFK